MGNFNIRPTQALTTFSNYITALPAWEKILITNVSIPSSVFQVIETMWQFQNYNADPIFYAATDGSAHADIGSYGWTLNYRNSITIASHSGPAYGTPSSSFWSEAYGLLSLLTFWEHIHKYTTAPYFGGIDIYIDSQSLVNTLPEDSSRYDNFGSLTVKPGWDVLQAIRQKLHLITPVPQLYFVRAHQETSIYNDTPVPVWLNAVADDLASSYTPIDPSASNFPPLIGGAHCQLHHKHSTMCSHYSNRLRDHISRESIVSFLQSKYSWSDSTRSDIDWAVYTEAISRSLVPSLFLTKYLYQ